MTTHDMIALTLYKNKSVGVFGLGKAGAASVAALLAGGAVIYAGDDKPEGAAALGKNANLHATAFAQWPWEKLDALVLAPGVPLTHNPHAVVHLARQHQVPIIGDIELLYRQCPDATYLGVTGTNGKSTTTTLIAHILQAAGKNIQVGGNLGTAALSLEPLGKDGIYVLETSSYQLDLLQTAKFHIAAFLNVTPDHLDRHGTLDEYVEAKLHIFDRQSQSDVAVVAVDDAYTQAVARQLVARATARVIPASVTQKVGNGVYVDAQGILHDDIGGSETFAFDVKSEAQRLTGKHNWQNAAVAYIACKSCGVSAKDIAAGMRSFQGLAHRMECVAEIGGVRFVNDSKATNADATAHALDPYENIYWILGGKPKAGGIESLSRFFPKIRHAFLIGQASEEFARTLEGHVSYTQCGTLAKAFAEAAARAQREKRPGAVVLLSPACASWDQWKSFEERGDAFRSMVQALQGSKA